MIGSLSRISDVVILPKDNSKLLYGIEPTIITREDVTSKDAWWKLASKDSPYRWKLKQRDFKNKDTYIKYFLLSLGLLEHPVILVGGDPRSGKSLFMAWYTYQLVRLFDKRATLDWTPPNPEYYGKLFDLWDESFQDELEEGFNKLALIEKKTRKPPSQEELEKFIAYNTVFSLDECDTYADRQSQTNLTKLIARILNRRGHVHICAVEVMIDTDRFAPILGDQASHLVDCKWQGHLPGYSSILIQDNRKGGTGLSKYLWLRPEDWVHLWNSHSISQLSRRVNIHFGNKPKKKKEEDN